MSLPETSSRNLMCSFNMVSRMGQYSYSQPSRSSHTAVSSTRRRSGGSHGFPRRCFCGLVPIIQTSTTVQNPGRRFYGCENYEDGGYHVFKWWDEAMMEEYEELKLVVEQQAESIRCISHNYADKRLMERMHHHILNTETAVAQLKEVMGKKQSGSAELKNLMLVASVILLVAIISTCICLFIF